MGGIRVGDKKFFSYATVATMGGPAYEAVKTFLEDFYRIGPPEVLYTYDPLSESLAAEAAQLIHCNPDEVTYIKNTTEGINLISDALPLAAGDEVLVQGSEYPANLLPWLRKRQDGITVTVVQSTHSTASFQQLLSHIGPHTKAVAISSAQYYDGYMADIQELSARCRERDIFLIIDAVQTAGIRDIDVERISVDFLVSGGQKYIRAGVGCGFLYVRSAIMDRLRHVKVGIRSMERFDDQTYTLKKGAARFQDGTQNLYGIVALHAALKHINDTGIQVIEEQSLRVLETLKTILKQYDIPFIDHGVQQSNIISLTIPEPLELVEFLKQHAIYIKYIKDVARISFVHDTPLEDIEELARRTHQWLERKRN